MFFAHRSKNHEGANRRAVRIPLELLVFLAWGAAIACGTLLALQYGTLAISSGLTVKIALKAARIVLNKALKKVATKNDAAQDTDRALEMVSDIITIGLLAIVSSIASSICACVSFISCIVACCMSGKKKQSKHDREAAYDEKYYQHGMPTPMSAQPLNGSFDNRHYVEQKDPVSYIAESTAPWQSKYIPRTAPTPFTPPSTYRPKVEYTPFTQTQYEPYHYEESQQWYGQQRR